MKKTLVEVPVFIYTVENHAEVKPELLRLIAETPSSPVHDDGQHIHKSDWNTPTSVRPYYEKMMEIFKPALLDFQDQVGAKRVQMHNYWFQQYEKNGEHDWHNHPKTMYGMVYYVELPDGSPPTNLLANNQVVVPDAKEGDILFFPSILLHRSPPNTGSGRKTSLVMNLNFEGYAS